MTSTEKDSLTKWAVGLVLLAVVALASIAAADFRDVVRANAAALEVQAKDGAIVATRVSVLESQYGEILRRLDTIDNKLDRMGPVSQRSYSPKTTREDVLNGHPAPLSAH
jgi:hypothetical protein